MEHHKSKGTPSQPDLDADPVDVNDPAVLQVHVVARGEGTEGTEGWVHTHGLAAFGLPELEIRGVRPHYLAPLAGHLLKEIAHYLLNGPAEVCAGDTMDLGLGSLVRFEPSVPLASEPGHYAQERWSVVDVPPGCCAVCEALDRGGLGPPATWGPPARRPN